jgi:hypothetical protein
MSRLWIQQTEKSFTIHAPILQGRAGELDRQGGLAK